MKIFFQGLLKYNSGKKIGGDNSAVVSEVVLVSNNFFGGKKTNRILKTFIVAKVMKQKKEMKI
jgi:hypothetical protein